jgi:hypothetical protein
MYRGGGTSYYKNTCQTQSKEDAWIGHWLLLTHTADCAHAQVSRQLPNKHHYQQTTSQPRATLLTVGHSQTNHDCTISLLEQDYCHCPFALSYSVPCAHLWVGFTLSLASGSLLSRRNIGTLRYLFAPFFSFFFRRCAPLVRLLRGSLSLALPAGLVKVKGSCSPLTGSQVKGNGSPPSVCSLVLRSRAMARPFGGLAL